MTMTEMRRLFAVELKTEAASQPLVISIENVVNLADYQAVTQLITGIQTLEQVRPIAVEGDTLRLALFGVDDADSLIRLMASQTELQWMNTDPDADGGLLLSWQG
jgi:muconolactone delta-isomerase